MKKNFNFYAVCWIILIAVFNVVCFVTPNEAAGMTKFGGAFWIGYIFIILAFIGQLVCAYIAFKSENLQKLFYNLPLITISYTGLVLTIIFGAACMIIPNLPNWVGIIIEVIILAFNAVSVIKASAAADLVKTTDERIKTQTLFTKTTAVNAQNIMEKAKNNEIKLECKKVYEAVRFSDPMSISELAVEEAKITVKISELSEAVDLDDAEKTKEIAEKIVQLIKERNNKCKSLK